MLHPSADVPPPPAVAHLRVYEPLATVPEPERSDLTRRMVTGGAAPMALALAQERASWLAAELAGGLPQESPIVLALDPDEVPGGAHRAVGPGLLVCPWDGRRRSAAALLSAAEQYPELLRRSAGLAPDRLTHARAVLAERAGQPTHVLSSTWGVPMGWFALVDPATRTVLTEPGLRRPLWRSTLADATVRAGRAQRAFSSLGAAGPGAIIADALRWFSRFPAGCALELDYAGLGAWLDTAALEADPSCSGVQDMVTALERGDLDRVGGLLAQVRSYWARVRSWEHAN